MVQISAQISINSSDMPSPGNIIHISTGLNVDFINYQETGEDYIWNFSQLEPISQITDTFVSQLNVPIAYIPVFMFSANLAKKEDINIPIPNSPLTNQYTFFNNTNNSFDVVGNAVTLYGIPLPLEFNSPDVLYQFPMEYENTGSSFAEYSFGIPNYGYLHREISRSNTVDGWGTLITPYGNFDVLRLKSEVAEFDSIYIDSLGMGLPLYREYTEYSWLGSGHKVPLLKITSEFSSTIVTYVDSLWIPTSVNNELVITDNHVRIFPNPTTDLVTISVEIPLVSDINIEIYNSTGIKVTEKKIIPYTEKNISLSLRQLGLNNGIYLLKVSVGDKYSIKKLILH